MNLNRLVRSACNDEDYCAYIIKEINGKIFTLDELYNLWEDAKVSDLTVAGFISKNKRIVYEL